MQMIFPPFVYSFAAAVIVLYAFLIKEGVAKAQVSKVDFIEDSADW